MILDGELPDVTPPLVKCPECGSDCRLEEVCYPSDKDPTYEFEFTCDKPYDEDDDTNDCATWFRVRTDLDHVPVGLVQVGAFKDGCQQHWTVPWDNVRRTRQSGRFKG